MATNERVFNFSAGPSTLPVEVLENAAADAQLRWHRRVCNGDEPQISRVQADY